MQISQIANQNPEEINGEKEIIYKHRINNLIKEITRKDWTIKDIFQSKLALREINKDYARALDKFDPTIFEKRYPDLFKK